MKTLAWLGLLLASQFIAPTQITQSVVPAALYRDDQILVLPRPGADNALAELRRAWQSEVRGTFPSLGGLQVVSVPPPETVASLIEKFQQSGWVQYAEPDYRRFLNVVPDDPKFTGGALWGLHNTGQNGGTADADIDAPEAWDLIHDASNVIVAVLDTGIRYTHEDLAANLWTHPLDGGHGFNAFDGSTNVLETSGSGHGTMVAGVVGAVGNNGKGITGVAWRVQLMAGKCFDAAGNSSDSLIIACLDYARTNGAQIILGAFDSPAYSQSLSNAIVAARDAGIIFVSSCGNAEPPAYQPVNVDVNPRYPAGYDIDNIVSVAYTDRNDQLGVLSNYGATNVDLAAPGENIYTTHVATDTFYTDFYSGTSLAAPHVAGALALMKARFPTEPPQQLIQRLLSAVDPKPALQGKCATGGRLNLYRALSPPIRLTPLAAPGDWPFRLRVSTGPNRRCVVETSTDLVQWQPVHTNITSATGTFDYTAATPTNAASYFFRATAAP